MTRLLDAEINRGKNRLRIDLTEWKGVPKLDIRDYYAADGEFLPGKRGIQLNEQQFKILFRALENNSENITKHFEGKTVSAKSVTPDLEVEDVFLSNVEFFRTVSNGDETRVTLNPNHPLGKYLSELQSDLSPASKTRLTVLISAVLFSFEKSLSQIDSSSKMSADDLSELLMHYWSKFLADYLR